MSDKEALQQQEQDALKTRTALSHACEFLCDHEVNGHRALDLYTAIELIKHLGDQVSASLEDIRKQLSDAEAAK